MFRRTLFRLSIICTLALSFSFVFVSSAQAAEIQTAEKYILDSNDIVPDNLIVAAGMIRINGQVEGDLIVAGGQVQISGLIAGDVIAAGGSIIIDETASVGKNLLLAGGQIMINGKINGNIKAFAGEVQINGPVDGNVVVTGGTFTLDNSISGSTRIEAEEINLENKASIAGDFKYSSPNKPIVMSSAKIHGKTIILPREEQNLRSPYSNPDFWIGKLLGSISYWILGLIVLALIPRALQRHVDNLGNKFWQSLGLGFVSLIAAVIGFFILAITIIGFPLALIGGAILLILLYVSKLLFAFYLMQKLSGIEFAKDHNKWSAAGMLFLSIVVIEFIGLLPVIGGFFSFVVILIGLGAHIMTKWQMYNEFYQKKLI